jgi:hypothetical protein
VSARPGAGDQAADDRGQRPGQISRRQFRSGGAHSRGLQPHRQRRGREQAELGGTDREAAGEDPADRESRERGELHQEDGDDRRQPARVAGESSDEGAECGPGDVAQERDRDVAREARGPGRGGQADEGQVAGHDSGEHLAQLSEAGSVHGSGRHGQDDGQRLE